MSQFRTACFACLAMLLAAPAQAQVVGNGVIDQAAANRQGLDRAWFSQVDLDTGRDRVLYATLHVNDSITFRVFEVRWGEQSRRFSSRYLDHLGRPLGEAGAERQATQLANQLREEGQFVEVVEEDVPQTTLYVQTDRAMLHAFDGETGATRWSVRLGNPDFPSTQPAASNNIVATMNGSTLHLLDAATGRAAQEERFVTGGPGAGPAVSETMAFVPKLNGMLEGFDLEDRGEPARTYQATGRGLVQPMVGGDTVSWATDIGELYVADADDAEIRFRVETGGEIVSPAMYRPADPAQTTTAIRAAVGRWYFGSMDGYVYCANSRDGDILWRYSTGETIVDSVVPLASEAYAVSQENTLYCIHSQTGDELWWHPNITRFLGASDRRAYCVDVAQNLVILDVNTGGFIGSLQLGTIDFFYTNPFTDRIYLGTSTGLIQCLHESDSEFPLVHQNRDQDGIAPLGAESGDNSDDEG